MIAVRQFITDVLSNPFPYWLSGVCIGFHLRDRMPRWLRKTLVVMGILSLIPVGITLSRGVGSVELSPSASRLLTKVETKTPSSTRSPMAPPPSEVLKRLHREVGEREVEGQTKPGKSAKKEIQPDQNGNPIWATTSGAQSFSTVSLIASSSGGGFVTMSGNTVTATTGTTFVGAVHVGTRKGPFCRVTCLVHHQTTYDVEVDTEFCQKNKLPPDADWIEGWIRDGQYDIRNPWPGPATVGFHSYKLYLTDKQEAAQP